jgi:glyoxylase-like metal-dependent hydrolase (beta-lactamase superfamily II)
MTTWAIGSVTVTRIEELLGFANMRPEQYFVGFEREVLGRHLDWLVPNHYSPQHDRLITSVHSWLIRTGRHTILLDCCAGNHKDRASSPRFHQLNTPFLERLRAAGAAPEDIDIVLCTHLHADHVGWNTVLRDGRWVPTFPNAKYLFSRTENAFWDAKHNAEYVDSVLPVIEAGQAVLLDGSHSIDERMLIEPAPGHTPGHVILKLAERGGRAVFCGDVIHHPLQVYAPHWNHFACEVADQARATRRRVLENCAAEGALLFPTHFGAPHVVSIHDTAGRLSCSFRASSASSSR